MSNINQLVANSLQEGNFRAHSIEMTRDLMPMAMNWGVPIAAGAFTSKNTKTHTVTAVTKKDDKHARNGKKN